LPFNVEEALASSKEVDPWIARFAGLRSDEVTEILRHQWGEIRSPAVASFRDAMIAFKPISVIHSDDDDSNGFYKGWWLRMKGPRNYHERETEVFLQTRPDRTALNKCIDQYTFSEREVISEFYWYYYKLVNSIDLIDLFIPSPWPRIEGSVYYDYLEPGHRHPDPDREWR
jgi:hypothetical protein